MQKKFFIIMLFVFLTSCLTPPSKTRYEDNIGESTVFHWQNDFVTFPRFVEDHKYCLGIKSSNIRSQIDKILSPLTPYNVPKWDGIWATFESRSYTDSGQRISVSTPPRHGHVRPAKYKKCMVKKKYRLIY